MIIASLRHCLTGKATYWDIGVMMEKFNYSVHHINFSQSIPPGRLMTFKQAEVMLKPLLFEVPGITAETPFIGRDWVFTRLEEVLRKTSSCEGRGAVIVGNAGSGKTAIIWRLVTLSCHGMSTPQGGPGIPQSPSSSPKCKHSISAHSRFFCPFQSSNIRTHQKANSYIHVASSEHLFLHIMDKNISFLGEAAAGNWAAHVHVLSWTETFFLSTSSSGIDLPSEQTKDVTQLNFAYSAISKG